MQNLRTLFNTHFGLSARSSLVIALTIVLIAFSSCFPESCTPKLGSTGAIFTLGVPAFSFKMTDVTELEVLAQPDQYQPLFEMRLKQEKGTWNFVSAPGLESPAPLPAPLFSTRSTPSHLEKTWTKNWTKSWNDTLADTRFINHFLDTLSTLAPQSLAPSGPLSSFGLDHPKFWIKWKTQNRHFEIQLGNSAESTESSSGNTATGSSPTSRFAKLSSSPEVYQVQGAALQMLTLLTGVEALRERKLIPPELLVADDIDELEYFHGAKKLWYAQRSSQGWVNEKNKPFKRNPLSQRISRPAKELLATEQTVVALDTESLETLMQSWFHLRIQSFETSKFAATPPEQEYAHLVLIGRNGLKERVTLYQVGENLIATFSGRPNSAFVLYPEARRFFE